MPEGDTVWLTAKRLHDALAGHRLARTDFRVPQLATTDLSGRAVLESASRGKHLLLRLDGGLTLHSHLRMEGSWHLYRPGERRRGGPGWQVRVALETADWLALGYRLPVLELVETRAEGDVVGHLGPDLLGADWQEEEAVRRIAQWPERTIGEALLDQRNLAGIGTLYRAETLFLLGLHPRRPVGSVVDLGKVARTARKLLLANRDHAGQVTTGDPRKGRQHYVFERPRQPCRRCGTPIRTDEFGPPGQERRSYWCPRCQPE